MTLESSIEARFGKMVRGLGGCAVKIMRRRGWPDRLLALPNGVTVWIEFKAPGKKAQAHQQRVHRWLRRRRHTVIVFDGANWYQVFTYLRMRCKLAGRVGSPPKRVVFL